MPALGWGIRGPREVQGVPGGIGDYIVYCKVLLKTQDGQLQMAEYELSSMGPTCHQMPLPWVIAGHMGVVGWGYI